MKWQEYLMKFYNGISKFMYGRNGVDKLSIALLVVSIVLTIVAQIIHSPWLMIVYYVGVLVVLLRTLSKDLNRRHKENQWFMSIWGKVISRFNIYKRMFAERNTHRFFKCPHCKTYVRVPKGKGKIVITCAKCKKEFTQNT